MFFKNKKSISPLIATILLVVVAVAIIAIVISWGKGFTNNSLQDASSLALYTESETGFYLNVQGSINGRTTFSYNPPQNTPYDSLTIVGYGLLGYTENIVPLEPPATVLKNQTVNIDHGIILPNLDLVLYLDNNTMITKFNLKQEIKQPSSCPEGYIPVPGNHLYGTMNERGGFCVMKWEAKTDANSTVQTACRNNANYFQFSHGKTGTGYDCNVSSYNIVSTSENYPIVNIAQSDASTFDSKEACASAGGHLITNKEWMTIARNIELVPDNWSGGSIGNGYLPRGNSDNILVGGTYVYDGTTPGTGINKRTLKLTNGQEVWDLAGNLFNWTSTDYNESEKNLPILDAEGYLYIYPEYNDLFNVFEVEMTDTYTVTYKDIDLAYKDLFLLNSDYNRDNGIGYFDFELDAGFGIYSFLRGGCWNYGTDAGVLDLHLYRTPGSRYNNIGLRCVQ
jgi:formylglycine-generating enzyme required for sulfatase activity